MRIEIGKIPRNVLERMIDRSRRRGRPRLRWADWVAAHARTLLKTPKGRPIVDRDG